MKLTAEQTKAVIDYAQWWKGYATDAMHLVACAAGQLYKGKSESKILAAQKETLWILAWNNIITFQPTHKPNA